MAKRKGKCSCKNKGGKAYSYKKKYKYQKKPKKKDRSDFHAWIKVEDVAVKPRERFANSLIRSRHKFSHGFIKI